MKHLLSILAMSVFCFALTAQNATPIKKWKIDGIGHQKGIVNDRYNNMSIDWMRDHTVDPENISMEGEQYNDVDNVTTVTGMSYGLNLSLVPYNFRNEEYSSNQEIRITANAVLDREAMVSYNENYNENMSRSTVFCLVDNEFNVSADYLYKVRLWRLEFGTGIGATVGSTINSKMLKIRTNAVPAGQEIDPAAARSTETYAAKNSFYGRIYVPLSIGMWVCNKMELFAEHRLGTGVEKVRQGDTNLMGLSGGALLGFRYHFIGF
jgi:hypothetical protein